MTGSEKLETSTPVLSAQLEKDLEVVRKLMAAVIAVLLILVAGFAYNIIVGDGLTFVKPSDELVESQRT